jgi:hypothetical protein
VIFPPHFYTNNNKITTFSLSLSPLNEPITNTTNNDEEEEEEEDVSLSELLDSLITLLFVWTKSHHHAPLNIHSLIFLRFLLLPLFSIFTQSSPFIYLLVLFFSLQIPSSMSTY